MKKNKWNLDLTRLLFGVLLSFGSVFSFGQTNEPIQIKTDIFEVVYSEHYQQPLLVRYEVDCPFGDVGRSGIQWYGYNGVTTSDIEDYRNNEWDRGHLAPAAAFNCDKETIKKTFSYLNCALQHEGSKF